MGGPFLTLKNQTRFIEDDHHLNDKDNDFVKFDGSVSCPSVPYTEGKGPTYPIQSTSPAGDLVALGVRAISEVNPINPVANAAVTLAELAREGFNIPGVQLWRDRTNLLRGVAKEFLSAEFGWLPLLDEVKNAASLVNQANAVMEQYKRDDGKLVRRRFDFPIERSTTLTTIAENVEPHLGGIPTFSFPKLGPLPRGKVVKTRQTLRKTWFSGAFTYHIPSDDDSWLGMMSAGNMSNKLLGSTLTPEVLWELTPWSWAIDWFSNTQQVIKNLQNIEIYGSVMAYGYLMDESIICDTYDWIDSRSVSGAKNLAVVPVSLESIKKTRIQANPFGFGVAWEGLSPTQLAIAAALGITRWL